MSILLRTADRRLDQYCLPTESIAKLGVKKIEVSIFRIRNKGSEAGVIVPTFETSWRTAVA